MLKFHPYLILTGDTRVEFVIYSVLNAKAKTSSINRLWCVTWYTTLALLTLLLGSRVTYTRPACVTLCPHSVFLTLGYNVKSILVFSSHKFDLLSIYFRLVLKPLK